MQPRCKPRTVKWRLWTWARTIRIGRRCEQPQAIDGRGVGWHHHGDYDEWTTESLGFRQQGERLALHFPLRHESLATTITLTPGADQVRVLTLAEDPRDFWRPHEYRDMGPGFTDCAESLR